MVALRLVGLEPTTFGTEIQYSFQLSYKRLKMIQMQTKLWVSDNSGAKTVKCIKVLGGFKRKFAKIGDTVVVSVQNLRDKYKETSKVKKREFYKGMVTKTKRRTRKKSNEFLNFDTNCVVLMNKQNGPLATRINSNFITTFKKKKYQKFLSLSLGTF